MTKTFALLSLALLVAASAVDAATTDGALRVTIHHTKHHETKHTKTTHARSANAKKFAKLAHMKATPWEADQKEKAAKCEDLCTLYGFYSFQEGRNCVTRKTDLCAQYKNGTAAMKVVLATAECADCDGAGSGSSAASGGDYPVPSPARG